MYCPSCAIDVHTKVEVCPSCGHPISRSPAEGLPHTTPSSTTNSLWPTQLEKPSEAPIPVHDSLPRFPTGTLLAERYRIVDLLGRGGMGEVYRADDLKLGQQVALKLLPASMEQEKKALALFLNEVRLARQISHPNVCRVHDVVEAEGLHFLTMEYIDGEDMLTSLRRLGRPSEARALELAQQICLGLEAAHQRGILHRDLKPANLMIDGEGHAHITDFGVAVLADQISGSGIHLGTPAYMAPEQLAGEEVSVRSDLYALGLVLYELFTGHSPFQAKDLKELRLQRGAPPKAPSELVEGLGPVVDRAILQCLEPDPRNRPTTALRVMAILQGSDPQLAHAVLKTLVECRFVPETSLGEGQAAAAEEFFTELVHDLVREHGGQNIEHLEEIPGILLLIDRPVSAVRFVEALHSELSNSEEKNGWQLAARVGIHLGEVVPWEGSALPDQGGPQWTVTGEALEVVSGLASLAVGGQSLLSRAVFDLARQSPVTGFDEVRWLAHGAYEITGLAEPLEVFEVGSQGVAPLTAPPESEVARRRLVQETIVGWRPAPGLELPQRPNWRLDGKLEEGGFGEVWLAVHGKTGQRRVFKFCYEPASLRSLQREITLFRLLKEELGDRSDINRILDWNFDEAPYFIEAEYTEGGNLLDWAEDQGGLQKIPIETRLEMLAQVATALAAAHSVGVLHKDVKPGNVLVSKDDEGQVRAQLSDFGVGKITEQGRLEQAGITVLGLTEDLDPDSAEAFSGTRLYMAPELMVGRSATIQADVYALGVVLYQMVVGDFSAALAPGWDRNVEDELLREDISVAVDGALERRLSSASLLAKRLRSLGERREALVAERRERERVEEAMTALELGRRRRRVVALVMVILVAFAGAMVYMWWKVELERDKVTIESKKVAHEAEVARQVSNFLVELFKSPAPEAALGRTVTARDILDRGAERIRTKLQEQPEVQTRLILTMAKAYHSLSFYDQAEELAREALAIRQKLFGEDSLESVESLNLLALSLMSKGNIIESEKIYRRNLELQERKIGPRSIEVSESLNRLSSLLIAKADHISAEPYLRRALGIQRSALASGHLDIANTMANLGVVLFYKREFHDAEKFLKYALQSKREKLGEEHPALSKELMFLAQIKKESDLFDEAELLIHKSIEINLKTKDASHPDHAGGLNFLGDIYREKRKPREAEEFYLQALDHYRESLGNQHPIVGIALVRLSLFYYEINNLHQANISIHKALSILDKEESENVNIALAWSSLALLLEADGSFEDAHKMFKKSLKLTTNQLGDNDPRSAVTMIHIARSLVRKMKCKEAESMSKNALRIFRKNKLPAHHWRVRFAEVNRGACLGLNGHYKEAEKMLLGAYSTLVSEQGESMPYTQEALRQVINLYETWGKTQQADVFRKKLSRRPTNVKQ